VPYAVLGQLCLVPSVLSARLRSAVVSAVGRIKSAFREATRPLPLVTGLAVDLTRSRKELLAENAFLRQQLIVASRKVKGPAFRPRERGLLVLLAGLVPRWRDAVLLVKPDTILRWHRQGFALVWRLKSRRPGRPRSRLSPDFIELIRRMAESNATWGAERIRGELLKLGIRVAKRTIQKYMRAVRAPAPPCGQRWPTFLRNHTAWACDFLQTYDIWFRPIFAFFIIDINTREVISVGVTRSPSETWTAQQLRNVTPFGQGPQFIIRDQDDEYGAEFDCVAKGAGIRVIRTAVRAPFMNSVCERFHGSVRREALDHVISATRQCWSERSEGCGSSRNSELLSSGWESRPTKAEPSRSVASLATAEVTTPAKRRHANVRAAASQPRNWFTPSAEGVDDSEGRSDVHQDRARWSRTRRGKWPRHVRRGRSSNLGDPRLSCETPAVREAGDQFPVSGASWRVRSWRCRAQRPAKNECSRQVGRRQGKLEPRPTGTRESEDPI
jgi:putative transposase